MMTVIDGEEEPQGELSTTLSKQFPSKSRHGLRVAQGTMPTKASQCGVRTPQVKCVSGYL